MSASIVSRARIHTVETASVLGPAGRARLASKLFTGHAAPRSSRASAAVGVERRIRTRSLSIVAPARNRSCTSLVPPPKKLLVHNASSQKSKNEASWPEVA
eukprot:scaffold13314_cov31-Tisochrysis_lutea.AAC.3